MGLDVVGDGCEFTAADVLADIRDALLDAARDVVPTICHAPGRGGLIEDSPSIKTLTF